MSETALSKAIQQTLEGMGCLVIRVQSGLLRLPGRVVRCAPKGTPDLCVLVDGGRTVWLEVKHGAGKASPEQLHMHSAMQEMGHEVAVVWSVKDAIDAISS